MYSIDRIGDKEMYLFLQQNKYDLIPLHHELSQVMIQVDPNILILKTNVNWLHSSVKTKNVEKGQERKISVCTIHVSAHPNMGPQRNWNASNQINTMGPSQSFDGKEWHTNAVRELGRMSSFSKPNEVQLSPAHSISCNSTRGFSKWASSRKRIVSSCALVLLLRTWLAR